MPAPAPLTTAEPGWGPSKGRAGRCQDGIGTAQAATRDQRLSRASRGPVTAPAQRPGARHRCGPLARGSVGGNCPVRPRSRAPAPRATHPLPPSAFGLAAPGSSKGSSSSTRRPDAVGMGTAAHVPHPVGTFPAAASRKGCKGGDGDLGFTPAQHFRSPHQPRHTRLITCLLTHTYTRARTPAPAAGPGPNPQHTAKKRAKRKGGGGNIQ